jgi:hypothetical protein
LSFYIYLSVLSKFLILKYNFFIDQLFRRKKVYFDFYCAKFLFFLHKVINIYFDKRTIIKVLEKINEILIEKKN